MFLVFALFRALVVLYGPTDRPLSFVSQVVMGNMVEEMKKAPLPIVHYGVDLWTCKKSSRKYIDVHVFYVDSNFQLQHALLAVSLTLTCPYWPVRNASVTCCVASAHPPTHHTHAVFYSAGRYPGPSPVVRSRCMGIWPHSWYSKSMSPLTHAWKLTFRST